MATKGIKVSVAKLLELVKQREADDQAAFAEKWRAYITKALNWRGDAVGNLRKEIVRIEAMDFLELDKTFGSDRYTSSSLRLQATEDFPVRPSKPDHAANIRSLELAADEAIIVDAGHGLGRYLS